MSKCNLFKPLESNTGTFYMFSQYTDDLTKEYSAKDTYRVVPSKYIALNLDVNNIKTTEDGNIYSQDYNYLLGEIFQNYYENACTFYKSKLQTKWKPELAYDLLFQTLKKYNILTTSDLDKTTKKFNEIQYIGDINIYSHNTTDGIGYNEIYCMIPNEANQRYYMALPNPNPIIQEIYDYTNIMGYEDIEDKFLPKGLSFKAITDIIATNKYYNLFNNDIIDYNPTNNYNFLYKDVLDENNNKPGNFIINTIIVLYDIQGINGNGEVEIKHRNIPMGIYFTGKVNNEIIDKKPTYRIANQITKYVNNDDIFGQGTSYGLRICSRYLCFPNITVMTETATEVNDMAYDMFSKVMTVAGESQALMAKTINNTTQINQSLKEHLANFKTYKTNVPYTRVLNGKDYWFINGKNTGVLASSDVTSKDLNKYQLHTSLILNTKSKKIDEAINELYNQNQILTDILEKSNLKIIELEERIEKLEPPKESEKK